MLSVFRNLLSAELRGFPFSSELPALRANWSITFSSELPAMVLGCVGGWGEEREETETMLKLSETNMKFDMNTPAVRDKHQPLCGLNPRLWELV